VLRGELAKVLAAKPGTRNDTLNKVAFTLGGTPPAAPSRPTSPKQVLDRAVAELGGDTAKSTSTAREAFADGLAKGA
jgi:hypothetical protein